MVEVSQEWIEAEKIIADFTNDFYNRFGVYVIVNYSLDKPEAETPKIPMQCLLDELNTFLKIDYPDGMTYKNKDRRTIINLAELGIRSQYRIAELVTYRYLFYYVSYALGYSYNQVSQFIKGKRDHSIVIHGRKMVTQRLEVNDREMTKLFNRVIPYLNNKYNLKIT